MCTDYNITIRTCKFVLKNVNMILNKGWNVCSKIMLVVRDGLFWNHRQDSCFENPSKEHHKLFFDQRLFLKGNITTLSQFSCSTEVNIRIFTDAKMHAKQLKQEQNKKGPFNTNAYLQIHTVAYLFFVNIQQLQFNEALQNHCSQVLLFHSFLEFYLFTKFISLPISFAMKKHATKATALQDLLLYQQTFLLGSQYKEINTR